MPATTASATREQLWIEPTGVVHSFDDEKHGQWAMKHLGLSYYQPLQEGEDGLTKEIPENWKDDLDVEEDAQAQLLKAGWVRMGFFRRSRWAVVYLQKDTPLTQAELALAQKWIAEHPEWQGPEIDVADPHLESLPMEDFLAANKPSDLRRLYSKQAAGPVPIPEGLVAKVLRAIKSNVRTYFAGMDQPVGERQFEIAIPVQDGAAVDGQSRGLLSVRVVFEDAFLSKAIRGAHVEFPQGGWPLLTVFLSGKLPGAEVVRRLDDLEGFYLQGILTHELAHVFDKLPGDDGVHHPGTDPGSYYNSPHEVRAYATQLWHYVTSNADYFRTGGADWLRQTGEKGLWELVDQALTLRVGMNLRRHASPETRRHILQVAYRAMQEILETPETKAAAKKAAEDAGITKADLQRIRPILREWVAGGWTDGPQLMRLLEKHKDVLAKFRLNKPVRLWRNERIKPGRDDGWDHMSAGWEDQYTRPTAWSMERMSAETYASGPGRRLVTAIVSPEDTYCCIPLVDHAARALGMKTFDPYKQQEVIVRPNPSFLDQIRPKVSVGEEAQLRRDFELALLEHHLPQLQEMRKTNTRAISDEELKRRIADLAKHKEIHDVRDELAKLQRGKAARKNAGILEPGFSVEAACRPTRYRAMTAAQAMNYQPKRVYDGDVLVTLDVAKVDASWRRDKTFYIEPGGGNQLRGRYDRFAQWLQDNPGVAIEPPDIGLTPSGEIIFGNGRHRFAVLRDQGAQRIAATVPRQDLKAMVERFGAQPINGTSVTASESVRTLVSRAQQLTKEDPLYEALGMYECGAFDGGCHICADALILAAGRGGLVRLVDDKGRTDHYGAKIDGLYCDFSGCYTTGDLWAKAFASLKHVTVPLHVEEGMDPRSGDENEPPRDLEVSKEIAALLRGPAARTAKTLFHGTSAERARGIEQHGLQPQVGELTATAYEDDAESVGEELEPLAFAGDKEALQRGVYSAMLHAIEAEGHDISDPEQAIRNWGALVILRDGDEVMDYRHPDDGVTNPTEHPMQVEPGDYYSRDNVAIDYILTGPTLVRYLKRHGVNMERWTKPFSEQKRNALIGMVRRAHPDVPVEKIVEKVNALTFEQFHKSWDYYTKLEKGKTAAPVPVPKAMVLNAIQRLSRKMRDAIKAAAPDTLLSDPSLGNPLALNGRVRAPGPVLARNLLDPEEVGLPDDWSKIQIKPRHYTPNRTVFVYLCVGRDKGMGSHLFYGAATLQGMALGDDAHIVIQVNPEFTVAQALAALEHPTTQAELESILLHEATHVVQRAQLRYTEANDDFKGYVNQRVEVEAFVQQAIHWVERQLPAGAPVTEQAIQQALQSSHFWDVWGPRLAPKNRKEVLKEVYKALAGRPTDKAASAGAPTFEERDITAEQSSYAGTEHPGVRIDMFVDDAHAGVMEFYLKDGAAYVRGSLVTRDFRGQGYGQKLYDRAIQSAKQHGAKAFYSDSANAVSSDAQKAWGRIRERYPNSSFEPGEGGYDSTGRHKIHLTASNNEDAQGQCHCTECGTEIAEGMVCSECAKTCKVCGAPTRNCKCASFVHAKDALCHDCWQANKTASGGGVHGWLLPDGSFRDASGGRLKEHWEVALSEFAPDAQRPADDATIAAAMEAAFNAGWVRVSMQGADAQKWTDHLLHRIQGFLQERGVLNGLRYYFLDSRTPVWSAKVEPATELLQLNKVTDLRRYTKVAAKTARYLTIDELRARAREVEERTDLVKEACEPKRVEGQGRVFRRIAAPLGGAAWQHILSRFPKEFQAEVLAERSGKSLEDIQELQNWRLTSRAPVVIPLNAAFIQQQCEAMHLPAEVVQRINEMWGLGLRPSGQVHDPNPERYFRYAQMPAATANPSIMLGPDIVWGVGRFVAACLRGDRSLRVWKLRQGKSASFLTKDDIKARAREIEQRTGKSSRQLLEEMHVSQDGDAFPGFVKEAKPIEVPGELLDALVSTVIPFLETEAAAVLPAQWLHEVSAGEARWSWHVGALVQRHLGDVGSAFPQLRMQVGFDRAKRFPQNRVTEAWSDPSTGVISILMAQPPTYHPIPTALVADLRQSLAHELAHLQQAAYQGVGAYTNRMREIAPTKNPDTFINTNYEVKAISAEFAEAFSRALHGDPTLSVEQFLSTQWQWPHIQEGMAPDARARILKDLAYVATHASAPKRGRRHSDHGSHRRASQNSVFYHGTRHDGPKPGLTGILWLTEDLHAAAVDATTHAHHGDPGCWKLTLDPQAHLVALWDLDVPAVRTVKDEASQHHAHITGRGVTDEEWVRASANGPRLETLPWMLRRLLDLGVDGVYVHEPVAGRKQLALALLNQDVVTSQEPAPLTHDAEVHHHVVGSRE